MDRGLKVGSQLGDRFHIADLLGHGEGTAAYLAADLDQGGAWTLIWEAQQMFRMARKPEGVLGYYPQDERHYLALCLEGLDLGLVYQAAGILEESWAALWLAQVADGIGQWHTRPHEPIVCLASGNLRLGDLRLTVTGRAILPGCDALAQPLAAIVPGQSLAFSCPEKELGDPLTPRSDVYALGAALYCLVTGSPPPDPVARVSDQSPLDPPRAAGVKLSGRFEKVILKALELYPGGRHESAMQLSFELDRCVPRRLRRRKIGEF